MTSVPILQHLQRLLAAQRWREARPILAGLLASRPDDRALLYPLCEAEIMDGAAARALQRLEATDLQEDPEVAFLHARAQAALGHDAAAREELIALRTRLPRGSANIEMHLAAIEERLGNPAAALAALRAAATLEPRLAAAHTALAAFLAAQGASEEACEALERGVEAAPQDVGLRIGLARAYATLSKPEDALRTVGEAVAAAPGDAASWHAIGQIYAEHFDWRKASDALAQAARYDPGEPRMETLASVASQELGDMEAASRALKRAMARDPDDLNVAVAQRLMLPQIYEDAADLARWRARYAQGLAELLHQQSRWLPRAAEVFALNRSNFVLAYQGEDDRALQRDYSRFVAGLAEAASPGLREPLPVRFDGGRRLRVGFVSSFFRDCTVGRYFERWITGLDATRFERFVYHAGALSDGLTRRLAAASDQFALLRDGSFEAARRLRSDALDVLVHPEVGMDPMGYILAALRLAPVQVAAWGHPVTTGSDAIDHYLSVDSMEPADGDGHYVERLLRLPGPGVSYPMPEPATRLTRADFNLPEGRRIYLCPPSLFKIHPEMDDLFADIAAADPEGLLVFFQATAPALTARFAARLQRALARRGVPPRRQVKAMPRMEGAKFRALLGLADVVLDTLHWSGGNTSFDAFAMAAPVVTMPGRFMRGRQTTAMLEAMGIPELVAASPDDYVARALQVAADRAANAVLRERIAANRGAIFETSEPLRALAEALLTVGSGAR